MTTEDEKDEDECSIFHTMLKHRVFILPDSLRLCGLDAKVMKGGKKYGSKSKFGRI